jgi:hypothetical protein
MIGSRQSDSIMNPRSARGASGAGLTAVFFYLLFPLDGQLRVRDREVPAVLQQRDLQGHGELAESR